MPQWGPWTNPLVEGLGALPQKVSILFLLKICYFVTLSRMKSQYLHSSPTDIQYEMEEKSIWRQKSGRASNNTFHWAQNVGRQSPALPNKICCQCLMRLLMATSSFRLGKTGKDTRVFLNSATYTVSVPSD